MRRLLAIFLGCALPAAARAPAAASRAEAVRDDVYLIRDDAGRWGGGTTGITHQCHPDYQAKKVLDLGGVPDGFWRSATQARLSVYFCVRDYSRQATGQANELDEAFVIVLNGKAHRYPTACGAPVFLEGRPWGHFMGWYDFAVPKAQLVRGRNEIVLRKVVGAGKKPDDYLYLGIDNTAGGGRSWVRFGKGAPWRQDKLTVPGGRGEYMVRLYLLRGERRFEASWRPRAARVRDPLGVLNYAGSHGLATRVEWNPRRLDALAPVSVTVELAGGARGDRAFALHWLDEKGQPVKPPVRARGPTLAATLDAARARRTWGLQLDKRLPVESVTLRASRGYRRLPRRVDMAPRIAAPAGRLAKRTASCRIDGRKIRLANANLRCAFDAGAGRLRLASLYNEPAAVEMVRRPDASALFCVEVADKRYAGSRDFRCVSVEPTRRRAGFRAELVCEAIGLGATLDAWIDDELHVALAVTNQAHQAVDFKLAFPHLSGLALGDDPAEDYYFFPWGGGIISDASAVLRRGYGDHAALYQVMDCFRPARGAGLAVRCTDDDGRYKVLALRKHVPGEPELDGDAAHTPTADEFKWTRNLPPVPGIGIACEYLRRTRRPGGSFAAQPVALWAHAGDWHAAMRRYADWCRRVWTFRPRPSRLTPVVNMIAAGWGRSPLFRNGKYRTDFIRPRTDCIELMSWWEWSPLGPWRTPWDKLRAKLGEAKYQRYSPYFVKDPVTGRTMYPINRGDYDGYNRRWGGLPAFREAIRTYRRMGALVTLYTDPILACDNTECGRKWGKRWGIVKPDGTYRTNYESWNMCHDVAAYRRYVVDTTRRVMRQTGADGIRLDEYGHAGAACFSRQHKHTFAEWGCTEWQRCIAETARAVRRAMDEVRPGSVLTTEHPGYDYLMQFLEGCITYDLTVQATPLRPLECNLQRFYFPECKAYELDHRRADPHHRKRFWNAVGSFGSYYPPRMDTVLRENADTFEAGEAAAFVPTPARHVYANRFAAGRKALYTLYNATGHTFAGPVLRLAARRDRHVFDLLSCAEADARAADGEVEVHLYLPRDEVACLAVLPAVLRARREGAALAVSVAEVGTGRRVAVCSADGKVLSARAAAGMIRFEPAGQPTGGPQPACVKLLEGGRLIDAVAVPPADAPVGRAAQGNHTQ